MLLIDTSDQAIFHGPEMSTKPWAIQNHLAKALTRDKPSASLLSNVVASDGAYSFDFRFGDGRQFDLLENGNGFHLLQSTIADDARRVSENAKRDDPLPRCALNISAARHAILEVLAEIHACSATALLRCEVSGKEVVLVLPTKEEMKAIAIPPPNVSMVVGAITGIGIGNRLEINGGEWVVYEGWSIGESYSYMTMGMTINAKKIQDNGVMKLIDVEFTVADPGFDFDEERRAS